MFKNEPNCPEDAPILACTPEFFLTSFPELEPEIVTDCLEIFQYLYRYMT